MKCVKVLGYIRVSTEEQAEGGLSLDAQREKIRAYCTINDLELVSIEADEGVSGKSMQNRAGLQRCFRRLRIRSVTGLVVTKLDRFSRSTKDVLAKVEEFDDHGWTLHSIAEKLDTGSAMGRFVVTIFAALAQMEREQISERTSAALDQKRKRHEKTGGYCPYGYDVDSSGKLTENDAEQSVIRLVLSRARSGQSFSAIARWLNSKGHRTKTGLGWTHVQVARLFNREC